ncbi:MAG: hypothetical protein IJX25_00185 [Clostridia bacterium]|nr:hypothetical protein [Clostridia bacterium]
MIDINEMTRKQIEDLPFIDDFDDAHKFNTIEIDSIVLLPTRSHHPSGYNYYLAIPCKSGQPLGKCSAYDTFSIFMTGDYNRVGIDCLRGSGLMRIFLPQGEYVCIPSFHEIRRR